jgi:hypothetical protein
MFDRSSYLKILYKYYFLYFILLLDVLIIIYVFYYLYKILNKTNSQICKKSKTIFFMGRGVLCNSGQCKPGSHNP